MPLEAFEDLGGFGRIDVELRVVDVGEEGGTNV